MKKLRAVFSIIIVFALASVLTVMMCGCQVRYVKKYKTKIIEKINPQPKKKPSEKKSKPQKITIKVKEKKEPVQPEPKEVPKESPKKEDPKPPPVKQEPPPQKKEEPKVWPKPSQEVFQKEPSVPQPPLNRAPVTLKLISFNI